jgi:hypothetical protein
MGVDMRQQRKWLRFMLLNSALSWHENLGKFAGKIQSIVAIPANFALRCLKQTRMSARLRGYFRTG